MRALIRGGGQVGALIAGRLTRERNEVGIVDPSAERCAELEATLDVRVVQGSASSVSTLRRSGLRAQVESRIGVKAARLRTTRWPGRGCPAGVPR